MNLRKKWAVAAGSILVAGALLTGAAFAAPGDPGSPAAADSGAPQATSAARAPKWASKLSQGQQEVMKGLQELRRAAMEKLKTDSQAVIDQAVTDGKLTQAEADQLKKGPGRHEGKGRHGGPGGKGGPGFKGGPRGFMGGPGAMKGGLGNLTQAEMQAKLSEAVTAGKMTQDQADQMVKKWTEHQARMSDKNESRQSQ